MDFEDKTITFFKDTDRKVFVIKGKWGVGKTHFWKQFIERNTQFYRSYSYVSLFGVDSIQNLNRAILSGSKNLEKDVKGFLSKVTQSPVAKLIGKKIGLSDFSYIVENVLLNDYLICFDDIERKAPSLRLSEILGYISILAEQKNCKVVIILNEDEINEDDYKDLCTYREKVVDIELLYEPAIKENYDIIFGINNQYFDIFKKSGLNNIRIMKKAKNSIDDFEENLSKETPQLKEDFNKQLVYYTCFHYGKKPGVDIQKLSSYSPGLELGRQMSGQATSPEHDFLEKMSFYSKSYDSFIISYLKTGTYHEDKLKKCLSDWNRNNETVKTQQELRALWRKYNGSFYCSKTQFLTEAKNFVKNNYLKIGIENIRLLSDFIKVFEDTYNNKRYTDLFIEEKLGSFSNEELQSCLAIANTKRLKKLLTKELEKDNKKYDIPLIIEELYKDRFDDRLYSLLNSYSKVQLLKWMKSDDENMFGHITFILKYSKEINNLNPGAKDAQEVYEKIISCLDSLSSECEFHKRRIDRCIFRQTNNY